MTQPLRFHLQVAPSLTRVSPASATVAVQTNPLAQVIVAATPGREGPQGLPGDGLPVVGEALAGNKDGVNTVFTTAAAFRADTTAVYLNGLREFFYAETGASQITFEDAPDVNDVLRIDYVI